MTMKYNIQLVMLLTGLGFPLATHCNVAPVELLKRTEGGGVLTNFGPIIIFCLCLIPISSVALAPKKHA